MMIMIFDYSPLTWRSTFNGVSHTYALQRGNVGGTGGNSIYFFLVELPPTGGLRYTGFKTPSLYYALIS